MSPWFRKKLAPQPEQRRETDVMEMLLAPNRTQEEFVLLYSKLVQERLPGRKLTLKGPTVIHTQGESGKESTIYLDNLWLQVREADEGQREIVERHLRMVASVDEPEKPTKRSQIVPIIKDLAYLKMLGPDPVVEHLVGDIWVVYAVDWEDKTGSLSAVQMEQLALKFDDLKDIAIENLKAILPDIECHGDGPWFLITAGGDYVASILLLDGVWDQLTEKVEGDIVAVAPSRDLLLFTGSSSREGLAAVRKRANEIHASGDHVISNTLIRRSGGKWIAYD